MEASQTTTTLDVESGNEHKDQTQTKDTASDKDTDTKVMVKTPQFEHSNEEGIPATTIEVKDGGWDAWKTIAGGWCLMFATFGSTNSFGVYQDFYARVYLTNYTPSQIGWIGSVQLFLLFFLCMPAGLLFDLGYFYPMVGFFSVFYCVVYFLLSLAKPQQLAPIFLAHGVGLGIGLGFLFLPALAVTAHHFKKRRALAMGVVLSGSSCGGMLFPWLVNHLIQTHGFAYATRVAASICVGMLAIACALMRTTLPPRNKRPESERRPVDIKSFFKEPAYVGSLFASFMAGLGLFFAVFYIQLFAVLKGVSSDLAFHTLTILNGVSFFGRLLPTFIGDIYGVFNVATVSFIVQVVMVYAMPAVKSTGAIVAFAAVYGFAFGTCVSVIGSCLAAFAKDVHEVGARMGIGYSFAAFGMLSFSPIAGALLGPTYNWSKATVFHGTCLLVCTILFIVNRTILAKKRGTQRV